MSGAAPEGTPEHFWQAFYRERGQIWSGRPNELLVAEAADLAPGRALDLGCGEGGDALWLAERGWRVVAVDVAQIPLDRGARQAAEVGLADRVDWVRQDLGVGFPDGAFDLVTACYLHSPVELDRRRALRAGLAAVAPGGTAVVVSHAHGPRTGSQAAAHAHVHLPSPEEVLEELGLPADGWTVERCEEVERPFVDRDGHETTRADSVVRARRAA
ncbi:SAM-dependent methyltransferase [Patulibacter sp. S7RM1-6]